MYKHCPALRKVRGNAVHPMHEAATDSGQIQPELAKPGIPPGPAYARSQGLILVTNNTHEFERIPGIRLSYWTIQ